MKRGKTGRPEKIGLGGKERQRRIGEMGGGKSTESRRTR